MKTIIITTIKGIILAFWYFVRYDRYQKFMLLTSQGLSQDEAFDLVYYNKV